MVHEEIPSTDRFAFGEDSEDRWLAEMFERRRVVFEQLMWQVPSASFAGQAFLLTIVLRPDTTGTARLIAALFGLGAAVGVLLAYLKHRWTEEVYSEWLNGMSLRNKGPKLNHSTVLEQAFAGRDDESRWDTLALRRLLPDSAFNVWARLLMLFVFGDLVLVVMSIVEVAGGGSLLA